MQMERQIKRVGVDIPVVVITVLDTMMGSIVDLSEQGAQIHGASLPAGTRFRIDYMGQTVFAQCRWAEVDRMGASFLFELTEGPLHERLLMAQDDEDMATGLHAFHRGRAAAIGSFGRRS